MTDIKSIGADFPILKQKVYGKQLIYFDNAATSQKPLQVINALSSYYKQENSNIHRGVHYLSQKATEAYENVRKNVAHFINAASSDEIIFTRGTTEAINLVAYSYAKKFLSRGDEVLISAMEHHSNIVPWQIVCKEKGALLRIIPIDDDGNLIMEEAEKLINEKTKLVAVTHISNALGTINPVKELVKMAHDHNAHILIDGAQAVPHMKVDVMGLDCDFYCFSSHKMYGPMGIGVLYGKKDILEALPPYQSGGEMIKEVSFEETSYNSLPFKFEAGTPNVGDALAFNVAIDYLEDIGFDTITEHESELLDYAEKRLRETGGIQIIGNAPQKAGVLSFLIENIHPYDAGTILDRLGIAVRTGHHCAQPIMDRLGVPGTIRASFGIYNTMEEIDRLVEAIEYVKDFFK